MKKRVTLLLVLCLLVLSLAGCKSSDYKDAVAKFESGDLWTAAKAFTALGDYESSADYLRQSMAQLLNGTWTASAELDFLQTVTEKTKTEELVYGKWDELHFDGMPGGIRVVFAEDGTFSISPSLDPSTLTAIRKQVVEVSYDEENCVLTKEEALEYLETGRTFTYEAKQSSGPNVTVRPDGTIDADVDAMMDALSENMKGSNTQFIMSMMGFDIASIQFDIVNLTDLVRSGTYQVTDSGIELYDNEAALIGTVSLNLDSETITIILSGEHPFFPQEMVASNEQE